MRTPMLALLVVTGCGGHAAEPGFAGPRGTASAARSLIATGDPVPVRAAEPASCRPAEGGYRWLGSDPHVPLAVSSAAGVAGPDTACCAAWGAEGETWTAIDAWGAPVAERTIVGGEGYDVTQCYELYLDGEDGPTTDAPLLVRGDVAWTAPPSARWEPTTAERASLLDFAAAVDRVFASPMSDPTLVPDPPPLPIEARVMFFQLPGDDSDPRVITRYAAIGGRALVIAGLDADGTWRTQYSDGTWGLSMGPWQDDSYQLLGVFDVDGDGFAEVLVHRSDGPSWDDAILRCEPDSTLRPWSVAAESLGGSTA